MKKKHRKIPEELRAAASLFGRMGGLAGRGQSKVRSNAREAALIRWDRVREAKAAQAGGPVSS